MPPKKQQTAEITKAGKEQQVSSPSGEKLDAMNDRTAKIESAILRIAALIPDDGDSANHNMNTRGKKRAAESDPGTESAHRHDPDNFSSTGPTIEGYPSVRIINHSSAEHAPMDAQDVETQPPMTRPVDRIPREHVVETANVAPVNLPRPTNTVGLKAVNKQAPNSVPPRVQPKLSLKFVVRFFL